MRTYLDSLGQQPRGATQITIQIGEAYLAYQTGDDDQALEILDSLLENTDNPNTADVLFLQGLIYLGRGEENSALLAFEEALGHQPPRWLAIRIDRLIHELDTN